MQQFGSRLDSLSGRPGARGVALQQLFARITEFSGLNLGAQEVVRLIGKSANLDDLQTLIGNDPSVVAQVLRRVNSPYYGLDAEVHDLPVAARLLGFREFSNLALTVHLSRMFAPELTYGSFSVSGLWGHSVAVAAAAQLIARVCGCADPSDAFLAGLLHDVGLLFCCRQMRRRFLQVVEGIQGRTTTPTVERQIYSFDHAQLGGYVARRWEFPTGSSMRSRTTTTWSTTRVPTRT